MTRSASRYAGQCLDKMSLHVFSNLFQEDMSLERDYKSICVPKRDGMIQETFCTKLHRRWINCIIIILWWCSLFIHRHQSHDRNCWSATSCLQQPYFISRSCDIKIYDFTSFFIYSDYPYTLSFNSIAWWELEVGSNWLFEASISELEMMWHTN